VHAATVPCCSSEKSTWQRWHRASYGHRQTRGIVSRLMAAVRGRRGQTRRGQACAHGSGTLGAADINRTRSLSMFTGPMPAPCELVALRDGKEGRTAEPPRWAKWFALLRLKGMVCGLGYVAGSGGLRYNHIFLPRAVPSASALLSKLRAQPLLRDG
jgi:hypothetical protein